MGFVQIQRQDFEIESINIQTVKAQINPQKNLKHFPLNIHRVHTSTF